jgi:aromatic-L-amino-acid decarboxylase
MMEIKEFREYAHQLVDWIADYYENIEKYPVKSQVKPGEILNKIPSAPPNSGESMDQIVKDFSQTILPGITHWQNPNFHAYFPANASYPSQLAEMLTSALATQCMIWDTSPAAAELEEQMMNWLKQMCGLPMEWAGVIHDGASTATLTAIITAREKKTDYSINKNGISDNQKHRIYCSTEAHSSVEKSVRISGIGDENLIKISTNDKLCLNPDALEQAIQRDIENGYNPLCVVAALGTTGTTAFDPLQEIASICRNYNVWLHVDAAYAGTALVLPEYRWMIAGINQVDSFVFNPHKWMFTHFDCTAYFVKDPDALVKTFSILPEYLKTTTTGRVKDYRDWGIPMGRRFRALKLWFVIRSFGVEGIQEKIRHHIHLAQLFESWVNQQENFEIMADRTINVVFFRFHPKGIDDNQELNNINQDLINTINSEGQIFLTHTKVEGKITLRMVIAQTYVESKHIEKAQNVILDASLRIFN